MNKRRHKSVRDSGNGANSILSRPQSRRKFLIKAGGVLTASAFGAVPLEIHKMGTAILLVEQNLGRTLSLVQRAYVLESGRVIMHGKSEELANNKQVQAAYLGI